MSVAQISVWHTPGCGDDCSPRWHDPLAHEEYGRQQERLERAQQIVRTGPLVVDMTREVVTLHGEEIPLSGRDWQMLAYLASRIGCWCPSRDIVTDIFGGCAGARADHNLVNTYRHRLRRRLGDAARLIDADYSNVRPRTRLLLTEVTE